MTLQFCDDRTGGRSRRGRFGDGDMKKVSVQAFEDRNRAEGGHAVILLIGLREVPSRPAFRLWPVGLGQNAELPDAWPEGDQLPLTARVTAEGVEFVVGPDLAEHPMLPAGLAVEIEIEFEISVKINFL